jgi:hypothetical protein
VPSAEVELLEESPPPGPAEPPVSREVRVAFDVVVSEPVTVGGTPRGWWLAGGLFLAALAAGFLLVWLLG